MLRCPIPALPADDPPAAARVAVLVVVLGYGALLLHGGAALDAVVTTIAGLGLVGAVVAGWLLDGPRRAPLASDRAGAR